MLRALTTTHIISQSWSRRALSVRIRVEHPSVDLSFAAASRAECRADLPNAFSKVSCPETRYFAGLPESSRTTCLDWSWKIMAARRK